MSTSLYRKAKRCPSAIRAYHSWKRVIGEATGLRQPRPGSTWVAGTLVNLRHIGEEGTDDELDAALRLYIEDLKGAPSVSGFRSRCRELVEDVRFAQLNLDVKKRPRETVLTADYVGGAGLVHHGKREGNPEALRKYREGLKKKSPPPSAHAATRE